MATYNDYIEYLKHVDNTTREEIDKQIDSLNKEISFLKSSLTTLQKEKDLLSSQFAKSQKDLVAKGDLLNVRGVEVDKLAKKQKELESKLVTLQHQKEDLSFSLKQAEQSLQQKTKENEEKSKEIIASQKLLEAASAQEKVSKATHETMVSDLKKELDNLRDQLRDKDDLLLRQQQDQTGLQKNLVKLQTEYNELLAKDSSSENAIVSSIREISTLKSQLTQEREQVRQIREQIEGVTKQNNLLTQKLKSGVSADAIKELQAELDAKKRDIGILQTSLSQAKNESQELQGSLKSQEALVREYKHCINTLKEQIEGVTKQNNLLTQKLKSGVSADAIKELQAELDAKKRDIEILQTSLSQAKNESQELQGSLKSQEALVREYKHCINTLKEQVNTLRTKAKEIKRKQTGKFLQGTACGLLALGMLWFLVAISVDRASKTVGPNNNERSTKGSCDYVEKTEFRTDGLYTGQRMDEKPHGIGEVSLSGDGSFEGAFKDGNFYYGKRILRSGKIYIGPYVDDQANGVGTYLFEDGSRYIGEFKKDAMHGYGIYIDANGHKSMGEFRNNEFIK